MALHRKKPVSPLVVLAVAVVVSWSLVAIIVAGIVSVFERVYK